MQLVLGILLAGALFVILKKLHSLAPEKRKVAPWQLVAGVVALVLLVLAVTGRIHVLVAAFAALVPLLRRLPSLLRYLPFARRVYQQSRQREGGGYREEGGARPSQGMTRKEACRILGVRDGCGREDVLAAHRRLMQKVHPDRGGNDYLASQVNEAKAVLLDKNTGV